MKSKLTEIMRGKRIQQWMAMPNHQLIVGLVYPSGRNVWVNGNVVNEDSLPDSVYEIGSITKTFIGLLLAIGEENGLWKSSDTLSNMIPEWASSPFAQQTTLLHLVTHTSGLPRIPHNIKGTIQDRRDPYANYDKKDITEAVLSENPRKRRSFNYSNYGYGLLGLLLFQGFGRSLHNVMTEMVFKPLQMKGTGLAGYLDETGKILPVYNSKGKSTPHWNFHDSMAGAGAICSTVSDMLHYLEANLGLRGEGVASALAQCHKEHFAIRPKRGIGIGYGWLRYKEKDGSVTHWHNGGTYGSNSFASFNRDKGVGLIIMSNHGPNLRSHLPLIGAGKLNVDKLAKLFTESMFD